MNDDGLSRKIELRIAQLEAELKEFVAQVNVELGARQNAIKELKALIELEAKEGE